LRDPFEALSSRCFARATVAHSVAYSLPKVPAPTINDGKLLKTGRTKEGDTFSSPEVSTVYAAKLREVRPLASCLGGSTALPRFGPDWLILLGDR
jgi:hypothetical protein